MLLGSQTELAGTDGALADARPGIAGDERGAGHGGLEFESNAPVACLHVLPGPAAEAVHRLPRFKSAPSGSRADRIAPKE
jgi:hypothetical protein